ncbi:MAG TPA: TIGR03618 family F420-dependent PPOX class oxidoreductase [Mycobacteriales bacterium]|nr:TIGR03618 family F420-dependent PPOX class oxidoreductase [Mycobacteriales bacterium]
MSKPPVPDYVSEMLARPNPAVIATVRQDGAPVSVATWYIWDGGRVLVNMDSSRKRLEYLRNDPRVSLTVFAGTDWGTHVSLQGKVVSLEDDRGLADIDRLARQYGLDEYPDRTRPRISAWIEIDTWHAWGSLRRE